MGSSHSQQTCYKACVLNSAIQDRGRRPDQGEIRTLAEASFPALVNPENAKQESSASREQWWTSQPLQVMEAFLPSSD